jgi:hypothetical protein
MIFKEGLPDNSNLKYWANNQMNPLMIKLLLLAPSIHSNLIMTLLKRIFFKILETAASLLDLKKT